MALSVAMLALLLVPITLFSHQVLVLWDSSHKYYYVVEWLDDDLVVSTCGPSGETDANDVPVLWSTTFVLVNLCLLVILPFAYLFSEAVGFSGGRYGTTCSFQ